MDLILVGFSLVAAGVSMKLLPNILKLIQNLTTSVLNIVTSIADLFSYIIPEHFDYLNKKFFSNQSSSFLVSLKNTILCLTQGLLLELFFYRSHEQQYFHFNYRNMPEISANKKYPLLCLFLVGIGHSTCSIADGLIDIVQFVLNSSELLIDSAIGKAANPLSKKPAEAPKADPSLTTQELAVDQSANLIKSTPNSDNIQQKTVHKSTRSEEEDFVDALIMLGSEPNNVGQTKKNSK